MATATSTSSTAPADRELYEQNEATIAALRQEQETLPQIGPVESVNVIEGEFEQNSVFATKLKNLKFRKIRRARRDGNCFYRSYLFGILEKCLTDQKLREHVVNFFVTESLDSCGKVGGYEEMIISDMQDEVLDDLLRVLNFIDDDRKLSAATDKTVDDVHSAFLKDDLNYSICYLRCCTSTGIKKDREQYAPFLEQDIDSFCISEVDPINKEADMVQIQALTTFCKVPIAIHYLDQNPGDVCNLMEFGDKSLVAEPINLLYRPGHYDLLYE